MPDTEHARQLLEMARMDLRPLPLLEDPSLADAGFFGFHLQQAAEKALKAWLTLTGQDYPKTHDLARLLQQITNSGDQGAAQFLSLADLTSFAVQYRYDQIGLSDSELDRPATSRQVRALVQHVEGLLELTE
jgi:HEPN domain-containing protein